MTENELNLKLMSDYYMDVCCSYTEGFSIFDGPNKTPDYYRAIPNGKSEPVDHWYVFEGPCRVTKEKYSVKVPADELYAMRRSGTINALTSLSADDREFLMNGYSPKGWDTLFNADLSAFPSNSK